MKGLHSNTKIVFAYQDQESRAAGINKSLDPNATGSSVIRVVVPKNEHGSSLMTHHNYSTSGNGLETYANDSVVGVAISKIIRTTSDGTSSSITVTPAVRSIARVQSKEITGQLFDINLSSALDTILTNGTQLYKAVIEIFFSSGDVEDLILNLRAPSRCKLSINPDDIGVGLQFPVVHQDVLGANSLNEAFVGYSVSKSYRSLQERKNAATGTSNERNIYGIGTGKYTTFSAPFGFVMDAVPQVLQGLTPASPIFAPGGFATSTTSHLTWFTGESDMTRLRIPSFTPQSLNTDNEVKTLGQSQVSLRQFFGRNVTVDDYASGTIGSTSYLERVSPEGNFFTWGHNYGWLSTLNDGDIRKTTDGSTVVSQNEMNFGVPPIFKASYQAANVSGQGDTASPTAFWGAFGTEPDAGDGTFLESFDLSTVAYDSVSTTNPVEVRYSKLFFGPNGKVPGTNSVDTDKIVGELNADMNTSLCFLTQYNLEDTRNYFCFYPTYEVNTTSDIRLGSVKGITVNPGANFFYTGTAGSQANAFMPVFKGIIRIMSVTRYASLDSGNTANMGTPIALDAIYQGFSDYSALDIFGMYYGNYGGTNRFNGIDLTMNLLFTGHTYPNKSLGVLEETKSQQLPSLSNSAGMMYLYTKGWEALKDNSPIQGTQVGITAQDIVFLNSAYSPDPHSTPEQAGNDIDDNQRRTISRNHPIGHALDKKLNESTAEPIDSRDHIVATTNSFTNEIKPFAFTSRAFHSDYGESANSSIPPYPYAPTSFRANKQKYAFANYANTTEGNEGYFNPNVSLNSQGDAFPGGNKAISFPSEIEFTTYLAQTGAGNCLKIYYSTVEVIGSNNTDLNTGLPNSNVTLDFKMRFINTCGEEFETGSGVKVTTGTTVAARVTETLNMFPHIEYRPLAMLSTINDNPFAYITIVEDDNDVDDISITSLGGDVYELNIVITSDSSDVIDVEGVPTPASFGDIFGDVTYPTFPSSDLPGLPEFSQRYISVEGQSEFSGHKASYITIASDETWPSFSQATADTQSIGADTEQLAFHTPFIAFNQPLDLDDVVPDVFGCTDILADNYNPLANVDDGSCEDCNTTSSEEGIWNLSTNGINNGSTGMRIGVYDSSSTPGAYLYGQIGGTQSQSLFFNPPVGSIYGSQGALYGGAVVASNDFAAQTSVVNLSIKAVTVGTVFDNLIQYLVTQYGEDATMWTLKIKPITDEILSAGLNFNESYSSSNPVPAVLTNTSAIYTATATGGTVFAPTWDNISTSVSPLAGLQVGLPYILELKLDPAKVDLSCTEFNGDNNVVLGLMWVAFCSCADTNNEYFQTAMNGATWPWQQSGDQSFPLLGYNSASQCPDTGSNPIYGDSAYPQSTCFRQDDALSDCNQYWLYCIANTSQTCATTINSLDDAYQEGGNYYFDFTDGSITTNIEGVYNSTVDGFVWNPDIEYTITVEGPGTYLVQNQNDAVPTSENILQNEFLGITEAGVYTVTFLFLAPYADGFNDPNAPCTFVETVVFDPPTDICEPVIPGCTDETSDNYDPLATYDDGTCENNDPCTETLVNPLLIVSSTTTPSGSICQVDTITVNGVNYDSTVIVPLNNGSVSTTITYSPGGFTGSITNFAILVLQESSTLSGINTLLDNVAIMFNTGNVPSDIVDGVTIEGIGFWSPLIPITGGTLTYTYTTSGLPAGNYYILAVADPSSVALENCGDAAFIPIIDNLSTTNIGLTSPTEDCPENCLGDNCDEPVLGCTDPDAENYSPTATYDDGTCEFVETFCEQNPSSELCIDCEGLPEGPAPRFASGSLDETICDPVTGSDGYCTDPNACNYNPDAPLDLSNNQICDYCSCVGEDDADCYEDTECDPDVDPNCQGPDPECPDPNNPDCDPTIYDPCPTGDCGPPLDPCIILGNCPEEDGGGGIDDDPFTDVVNPVEVTCAVDVEAADGEQLNFSAVQQQAFLCMSQEGQKMLFRMKSGAYYDDTDVLKLSLIAYLFAGGLNKTELPCLFNCNYDSADKAKAYSCSQQWAAAGSRYYNSTDSYSRGDIVMYYYLKGGKVTRNYYTATRDIQPIDLQPRYFGSGWHRCQDITLRTADKNNIATGDEEYLQVFWEFMTRFCNECEIGTIAEQLEDVNNVDPTVLKNYLDPKTNNNNLSNNSGIIGEDGEEIIF